MSAKFTWDAENSMQMLLLVIAEADVKPSSTIWTQVADKLGHPTPSAVSQKFYKLKREYEQLKANDGTAGPSTPKTKANAAAKTPGTGRGRKRKEPAVEDGGSTNKRTKKAAKDVAEEVPEDESEEGEAQDKVKLEIMEDSLFVAIIKTSQPKLDHKAIAAYMGEGRTGNAIQHQIRKLQKLAANISPSSDDGATTTMKKPTSKKGKEATAKKGQSAGGCHKQESGDAVEPDSEGSPTKKRKLKREYEPEDNENGNGEHVDDDDDEA